MYFAQVEARTAAPRRAHAHVGGLALFFAVCSAACGYGTLPAPVPEREESAGTTGAVRLRTHRTSARFADYERAARYVDAHAYAEALKVYRTLADYPEERATALVGMGSCFDLQRRIPEALECFQEALALDTGLVHAAIGCAAAHYHLGAYEQAIAHYRQAQRIDPALSDVYWGLAVTYEQLGQRDSAVANAQRFITRQPDSQYVPMLQELIHRNTTAKR